MFPIKPVTVDVYDASTVEGAARHNSRADAAVAPGKKPARGRLRKAA
jgi:hypothetical protein